MREHGIECAIYGAAETGDVEQRMSFAVADVAGLARLRDEQRTKPVRQGKPPRELEITTDERSALLGRQAIDGAFKRLIARWKRRKQWIAAAGHGGGEHNDDEGFEQANRWAHVVPRRGHA